MLFAIDIDAGNHIVGWIMPDNPAATPRVVVFLAGELAATIEATVLRPTLREQGLANVVASGWYGFMAPAATPQPIVDRLQAEIIRVLGDPEVKQKLIVQGLEAKPGTAAEFGKFIDDETRKWGEVIRAAGLKGE